MDLRPGRVVIAPEVIATIVRMTVMATPGVARLGTTFAGRMSRVWRGARSTRGIDLQMREGAVAVDIYIVATREAQMRDLAERLQREVRRGISEVVGMPVQAVNVHIQDVADPFDAPSEP